MSTIDKLLLVWRSPSNGAKVEVGILTGGPPFTFTYTGLEAAKAAAFPGLPEFPIDEVTYRSEKLFATFRNRIPSARRPDYKRLLAAWGVTPGTPDLELLARSGGFLLTDRLELAEHREVDNDLSEPLLVRIAGQKYYADPDAELPVGTELSFRRDPENEHDPCAVEVLSGGEPIGFIPNYYSGLFARLLETRAVFGYLDRRLLVPGEPRRWVAATGTSREALAALRERALESSTARVP